MNKEKADKIVTITLTDERPVKVRNGDWPVMASASHDTDHNNQEIFRRHYLRVRIHDTGMDNETHTPHPDGRCLVYGWYESSYQTETGEQAGYRCHINDVVETIRKVGEYIHAPQWLVDQCIADLPAQEDETFPRNLSITVTIATAEQAAEYVTALIALEQHLRQANGISGHMPASPLTKLADSAMVARQELQRQANLVTAPE